VSDETEWFEDDGLIMPKTRIASLFDVNRQKKLAVMAMIIMTAKAATEYDTWYTPSMRETLCVKAHGGPGGPWIW
jgi:hypothetical protein